MVYVTGHGFVDGGEHWIALHKTDLHKLGTTAMATHELLRRLFETGVQNLLLIVDTCYSGEAVSRLNRDLPDTWIALGSSTRNQQAEVGRVSGSIREFLKDLHSPVGQRFGHNPYLDAAQFITGIQDMLPKGQDLSPLSGSFPRSLASPCLPNPWYRPDAELPVARRAAVCRYGPRT